MDTPGRGGRITTPTKRRGPSGTQPHPKGRPITSLSSAQSTKQVVYFIAYRHKFWDTLREPFEDSLFIWEFYYSKTTFDRAKKRELAQRHPKMYAGQFPLAALLHPKIATLLTKEGD